MVLVGFSGYDWFLGIWPAEVVPEAPQLRYR